MKRFLAGVATGVGVVVIALALWWYVTFWRVKDDLWLFEAAPQLVESSLPGARVLDISISPDAMRDVNYVYDELYDANVTYERLGRIKRIVLTYGRYRGHGISPNVSELVILDDKAEVVHTLSSGAR